MKVSLTLSALLLLAVLSTGCDDTENISFDFNEIQACHQQNASSADAVRSMLIGTWDWEYVYQIGRSTGPEGSYTEYEGTSVEFRADSTGVFTEADGSTQAFTWEVEENSGNFLLQTDKFIVLIRGYLWLCDGVMVCNASVYDGDDNYFVKAE